MKKSIFLFFGLLLFSIAACSNKPITFGNLEPESKHALVANIFVNAIENYHYNKVKLTDSISSRVFNEYIKSLDGNRAIFLQTDISEFENFRYSLDDAIKSGNLQPAYTIYNRYITRLNERIDFSLEQIKKPVVYESADLYVYNRENEPWFKTVSELDNYWNKRIRYDFISLKISSDDEKRHSETITRRYENLKSQLSKTKSEDVFQTFLSAFAKSIDPHTAYFSPRAAADFNIDMSNSLEGIGARLQTENDYTRVASIVTGGPADKGKELAVNDRIVGVAQGDKGEFEDVLGWRIDDVVSKIRGAKGTVVRLQVIPAGADINTTPVIIRIVRDKVILEDQLAKSEVKTIQKDGKPYKIGIISIPSFYIDFAALRKGDPNYNSTSKDVKKALELFKSSGVDGVIIDLRNNGGGSLKEAIELTGLFINGGPVVQVREGNGKIDINRDEDPNITWDGPLTVMINRFSASASEIFAGAIQDYGRGVVIGEQSYGKGTVQSGIDLSEFVPGFKEPLGQLNLTMAKFYRINGGSTQHKGIIPDVIFPSAFPIEVFGESSEPFALTWDQIGAASYKRISDLSTSINQITTNYQIRKKSNPEFNYLYEDIQRFEKNRNEKSVVLSEITLRAERQKSEEEELNRYNARRKLQGLPAVAKGETRPVLETDFMKDEGLLITAELIAMLKN